MGLLLRREQAQVDTAAKVCIAVVAQAVDLHLPFSVTLLTIEPFVLEWLIAESIASEPSLV